MSSEALEKLKSLTDRLQEPPLMMKLIRKKEGKRIVFEEGSCWGDGLLYIEDLIAVGYLTAVAGYHFEEHTHTVMEIGIVKSGLVQYTYGGRTRELGPNDVVVCQIGEPHSMMVLEDSVLLFATIPPAEGYPK